MPCHLSFELLRLAEDGKVPWKALLWAATAHDSRPSRQALDACASRRLRSWRLLNPSSAQLASALGLVPAEIVAPGEEVATRALLTELQAVPTEQRRGLLLKHHRLVRSSPTLLAGLLAEAQRSLSRCPAECAAWLSLAHEVMTRQRGAGLPPEIQAEGEIRYLAHEANFVRVQGDLLAAARRFEALGADLRRRTICRLATHAELWSFEASLCVDRRQFERALELLRWAEAAYDSMGDRLNLAKILIEQGNALEYGGDSPEAVLRCRRAAQLLESDASPRLAWLVQHNLADSLVNLGRIDEALEILAQARRFSQHCNEPSNRMRIKWLEARIARAEGRLADAARGMRRVADDCMELQLEYDAALAFLDLAEIRLAQGKTREVQRLTAAMEPVFRSKQVHREANAALLLFREAAEAERLDAAFLAELRRYLLLARNDRDFAFRPGLATASEVR